MRRSFAFSLLLATTTLAVAAPPPPATHVVAVSGEVSLTTAAADARLDTFSPAVTAATPGEFVVVWASGYLTYGGSELVGFGGGVQGRRVGLHAQPLAPELDVVPVGDALTPASPRIAGNASGRFVVTWELADANFTVNRSQFSIRQRQFGADAKPLGPEVSLYASAVGLSEQRLPQFPYVAVGMDPAGRSVAAWLQPLPLSESMNGDLHAQLFDASGKAVGGGFAVTGRQRSETAPAAAMDGQGNAILVYESGGGIFLRRYDSQGRPLGGEVQVPSPAGASSPKVGASAGGSFVVVWSTGAKIAGQRFDAAGRPDGPVLELSQGSREGNDFPDVSMDSRGNFAVAWEAGNTNGLPTLLARVFSREGVPQGGDVEVPAMQLGGHDPSFDPASAPSVALAENGTFLVTWHTFTLLPSNQISARAFRALSNRDRCVYRGDTFLCGGPGDALTPVVQLGNGTAAGDVPFLGDVDGDGADDPCIRHGAAFSCALSGSAGRVQVFPFGAASHVPLLGDVNGDGRADPCVHRGRFFLCDTAHDGGLAEVKIPFGLASDLPLMGDVNGDGRADPCVFRDGQFLCDTSHDGVRDLVQAEDIQPGDLPLLGDADGDGRADFCVVRGTRLLCDLERSGELTAQPMPLQPGDVVLLGKVDRL
jgi:hypothetical protein